MKKDNSGFLYGLIAGLVVLVVSGIIYAVSPVWFLKLWWVKIIIIIGFMVYSLYLFKKNNNDVLPFQTSLRNSYAVWVVGFLIWFAFKFALYNYIDPNLTKAKKQLEKEFTESVAPTDKKDLMEKNLDQNIIDPQRVFIMEVGFTLIIGFFYALMIGGVYSITNKKIQSGDGSN